MPTPDSIGESVGSMFGNMLSSGTGKYIIYIGYFLLAMAILAVGFIFYYWTQYKYKITIFEGSLEKNDAGKLIFHPRMIKRDRAMPILEDGIQKWRLLFNFKKRLEPINFKYIQPGNHVFLYRTGPDTFNPMPITGGNPSATFEIDPFDRAFLNLGVQSDAREYMKDDAMKKAQMWMFVSGLIILVAVVVTGWLILKYSSVTAGEIKEASNLLRGITNNIAPK